MNMERTGRKIKHVREDRDYDQKYMATQLGIAQNTCSLWEKGRGLTEDGVRAIAKILEVDPDWLLSPDPVTLNMTNNHGNNGYVSIQNQQQHTVPVELLEKWMQDSREREVRMMEFMKQQGEVMKAMASRKS